MTKDCIIGSFVGKKKILSFIERLRWKLGIRSSKVFIYEIDDNDHEYFVTVKNADKEDIKEGCNHCSVMHSKCGCFFTINALNKLVDEECGEDGGGNQIDWTKYSGKLILVSNDKLKISGLSKVEDKCCLFD